MSTLRPVRSVAGVESEMDWPEGEGESQQEEIERQEYAQQAGGAQAQMSQPPQQTVMKSSPRKKSWTQGQKRLLFWGAVAISVLWIASPTVMRIRNAVGRVRGAVFGGGE